jgi:hypothetical protein
MERLRDQDRVQWRTLVNKVMNAGVPLNARTDTVSQEVTLQTRILETLGSNLERENNRHESDISQFSSVFLCKRWVSA